MCVERRVTWWYRLLRPGKTDGGTGEGDSAVRSETLGTDDVLGLTICSDRLATDGLGRETRR